jgi:hypothetical protein
MAEASTVGASMAAGIADTPYSSILRREAVERLTPWNGWRDRPKLSAFSRSVWLWRITARYSADRRGELPTEVETASPKGVESFRGRLAGQARELFQFGFVHTPYADGPKYGHANSRRAGKQDLRYLLSRKTTS